MEEVLLPGTNVWTGLRALLLLLLAIGTFDQETQKEDETKLTGDLLGLLTWHRP